MPKEKTPQDVYNDLVTQGFYEEANLDKDEIQKVRKMAMEDYDFFTGSISPSGANIFPSEEPTVRTWRF